MMNANTHYEVTGMTCGGCAAKVQAFLTQYAEQATVTLNPPEAALINQKTDLMSLNIALEKIGHYKLIKVEDSDKPIATQNISDEQPKSWLTTYYPLLLIIGFIVLVSTLIQFSLFHQQAFNFNEWMMHFMAGFFLIFSFFKLLDIKSFASSYAMYDLLAMRIPAYGLLYPFIELGLGIAYILAWQPTIVNLFTFFIMTFSSLGVIRSVLNKQKIRCACLGSVFNLPMSTVTIIEDLTMAGMALYMLI